MGTHQPMSDQEIHRFKVGDRVFINRPNGVYYRERAIIVKLTPNQASVRVRLERWSEDWSSFVVSETDLDLDVLETLSAV